MIPTLKIAQVANDFIVYPDETKKNYDGEQTYVFQTFAELVEHLGGVFLHRQYFVSVDESRI